MLVFTYSAHYIFEKGAKEKVKIADLFFHDRLPILFLVDSLGQQHAYRFDAQIRFLIASMEIYFVVCLFGSLEFYLDFLLTLKWTWRGQRSTPASE
jgi:hypothetical protein